MPRGKSNKKPIKKSAEEPIKDSQSLVNHNDVEVNPVTWEVKDKEKPKPKFTRKDVNPHEYLNHLGKGLGKLKGYRGYVLYFFNPEHLECELKPLKSIQKWWRNKYTGELFELGNATFFMDGLPVFLVFRNVPYSIEFEYGELSEDERKILTRKGYSAAEIEAKLYSAYTQFIFKKKTFNFQSLVTLILAIILTALVTFTICNSIMGPAYTDSLGNTNSTVTEITSMLGGLLK